MGSRGAYGIGSSSSRSCDLLMSRLTLHMSATAPAVRPSSSKFILLPPPDNDRRCSRRNGSALTMAWTVGTSPPPAAVAAATWATPTPDPPAVTAARPRRLAVISAACSAFSGGRRDLPTAQAGCCCGGAACETTTGICCWWRSGCCCWETCCWGWPSGWAVGTHCCWFRWAWGWWAPPLTRVRGGPKEGGRMKPRGGGGAARRRVGGEAVVEEEEGGEASSWSPLWRGWHNKLGLMTGRTPGPNQGGEGERLEKAKGGQAGAGERDGDSAAAAGVVAAAGRRKVGTVGICTGPVAVHGRWSTAAAAASFREMVERLQVLVFHVRYYLRGPRSSGRSIFDSSIL